MTPYSVLDEQGEMCLWPQVINPPPKAPPEAPLQPLVQAPHDNSVGYWLGHMRGHLQAFKEAPSDTLKAALLVALNEYQEAVSNGLEMPKTLPPPLPTASTFSDWYYRQLDEALTMYRINPSSTRLDAMQQHLQGFQDALAMGKVKRW